jgi:hypothetical protein
MGLVTPRQNEHLGTTDVGIIKSRRRLLKESTALQDGTEPFSAANGSVYHARAGDVLLDKNAEWLEDAKSKDLMKATW